LIAFYVASFIGSRSIVSCSFGLSLSLSLSFSLSLSIYLSVSLSLSSFLPSSAAHASRDKDKVANSFAAATAILTGLKGNTEHGCQTWNFKAQNRVHCNEEVS
jgi:hypothetical protein